MRIRISLILTHEFFGRRRARLDDRDNEVSGSARPSRRRSSTPSCRCSLNSRDRTADRAPSQSTF